MGTGMRNISDGALPITRRAFGGGILAGGLLGAGAGTFGSISPAEAAPTRGGTVRVGLASQSTNDTFDSAKFVFTNDYLRGTSVYSYLTRMDGQGVPQPEVALSWEPSPDATRWVFKIRQGVTFSDGTPLTLDDIVFSVLRHKEDRVASSAKQLANNIKAVTKDGPDSILVELQAPDVDLPIVIGIIQFALVKAGTYDFSAPIGTGPFVMKEFRPGLRTVLARNPRYWKDGRPYLDQIELFTITDATARANALLSGDAEMVIELRGSSIDEVAKSSTADVFVTPSIRTVSIQAAVDRAPSSNIDLALAMNYLIDRKRALSTIVRGYGAIANDVPIISTSPLYNSSLPQRDLDLDRAKYHIAKSGFGNSKVEVAVSDASIFSVDFGQLLQREAARAGLNLDLKREPADSYWSAVAGKRPFFATNFHPRPTVNMTLNLAWKSNAVWNFSHYNNPELDKLIDMARATLDKTKQKEAYDQIQSIIYNSGAVATPCFLNYVDGVSKKVKGLQPVFTGNLGGFNFADTVWLES